MFNNVHIIEGNIRKNYGHPMHVCNNDRVNVYVNGTDATYFKCKNNQIIYSYEGGYDSSRFVYYVNRCLIYKMVRYYSTLYQIRKYCVVESDNTTDFYKYKYNENSKIMVEEMKPNE